MLQGDITLIGNSLTYLAGNLTALDLSDNYISGNLSGTVHSSQNGPPGNPLADVSSTKSGTSSNPFCELAKGGLQLLNFQSNLITGSIPACLFEMGKHLTVHTDHGCK